MDPEKKPEQQADEQKKLHEINLAHALSKKGLTKRVLVVDDNVETAKTLGWMLEALGYEYQLATSGAMAIEMMKQFSPNAVMLDIGMPGMNGYELCQILRQSPHLRQTVFIAQTGWDKDSNFDMSKEAGFDHYLTKPVEMSVLEKLLKNALYEPDTE